MSRLNPSQGAFPNHQHRVSLSHKWGLLVKRELSLQYFPGYFPGYHI